MVKVQINKSATSHPHASLRQSFARIASFVKRPGKEEGQKEVKNTKESGPSVSFAPNLLVREFNTILGDHPCVSSGVPVCLGWTLMDSCEYAIEEHEQLKYDLRKESKYKLYFDSSKGVSCPKILKTTRTSMLKKAGYTPDGLRRGLKSVNIAKKRRVQTAVAARQNTLDHRVDEFFENFCCNSSDAVDLEVKDLLSRSEHPIEGLENGIMKKDPDITDNESEDDILEECMNQSVQGAVGLDVSHHQSKREISRRLSTYRSSSVKTLKITDENEDDEFVFVRKQKLLDISCHRSFSKGSAGNFGIDQSTPSQNRRSSLMKFASHRSFSRLSLPQDGSHRASFRELRENRRRNKKSVALLQQIQDLKESHQCLEGMGELSLDNDFDALT